MLGQDHMGKGAFSGMGEHSRPTGAASSACIANGKEEVVGEQDRLVMVIEGSREMRRQN